MDLNDLIERTARAYSIDRAAAVQAIVAIAGVFISVSASIAALVSAWATARSVREMRAARLQQARPALRPVASSQFEFIWRREANNYNINDQQTGTSCSLSFGLKNVGFGSAQDVDVKIGTTPIRADLTGNPVELKRLFAASGLQIIRANNGVEIRDPDQPDKRGQRLLTAAAESAFSARFVEVNQTLKVAINSFFTEAFLVPALSSFEMSRFSWVWPVSVRYFSLAGERYEQTYVLALFAGEISFTLAAPIGQRAGIPNWSELRMGIDVAATETAEEVSLVRELVQRGQSHLRRWMHPGVERLSKARRDAREWLLYTRLKATRFQIGDRVEFKPHAEWQLMDDDRNFVPPELQPIDGERYRSAEEGADG